MRAAKSAAHRAAGVLRAITAGGLAAASLPAPAVGPAALAVTALTVGPAAAEDWTFKRIGAPKKGQAGKRITVQIAIGAPTVPPPPAKPASPAKPGDPGSAADAAPAQDAPKPGPSDYAWYWDLVSPALAGAGAGRFLDAVEAVDRAPKGKEIRSPRMATLQAIAEAHGPEILKATVGTRVSPALVLAVISVESAGNPAAVSSAGATGLMQLMPATASRFGVSEATDPVQNISGGVAYLNFLMGEFGDDAVLALAGYNAGEGAVRKNDGVPPYAETRDYVPKVLAAWKVARGLCLTPPQLPGDGCVFAVRTASN